jgi:hypothetical protein
MKAERPVKRSFMTRIVFVSKAPRMSGDQGMPRSRAMRAAMGA